MGNKLLPFLGCLSYGLMLQWPGKTEMILPVVFEKKLPHVLGSPEASQLVSAPAESQLQHLGHHAWCCPCHLISAAAVPLSL